MISQYLSDNLHKFGQRGQGHMFGLRNYDKDEDDVLVTIVNHLIERQLFTEWWQLSRCQKAVPLLEAHLDKVDWRALSFNPAAIHILEAHQDNIDWDALSENPNPAVIPWLEAELLRENPRINWERLSGNPAAIRLLEANFDRISWKGLSKNPNPTVIPWLKAELLTESILLNGESLCLKNLGVFKFETPRVHWANLTGNKNYTMVFPLLETKLDKINWFILSDKSYAIDLLEANQDKIVWGQFIFNEHERATPILKANLDKLQHIDWPDFAMDDRIDLLLENMDKIIQKLNTVATIHPDWNYERLFWGHFSKNSHPEAIKYLEANPDKINWSYLSLNRNAIHLLEAELLNQVNRIDWERLSINANAIHILEKYPEKIDWEWVGCNPNILELFDDRPSRAIVMK